MEKEYKVIKTDEEARKAIKDGIDKVAKIIGDTLGPYGRNVLLEQRGYGEKNRSPIITNDGVSIAKRIILEDEGEDAGAQAMIDVTLKTSEMAGDGTTTSIVLAQAIIDNVFKQMAEEKHIIKSERMINPMTLKKEIDETCEEVVKRLKKSAKPVKAKDELIKVATIALENPQLGAKVADIVYQVGIDGYVGVEEGYGYETKTEVVSGMRFPGNYIKELAAALATNPQKEAVMENPFVFVTNAEVDNEKVLRNLCDGLLKEKITRHLVLLATDFHRSTYPFIVVNKLKNIFSILPIQVKANTPDEIEDVAYYTGAKFFTTQKGFDWETTSFNKDDFGKAKKVIADKDKIIFIEGKGDKKKIRGRIAKLKVEKEKVEKIRQFKEKVGRRIASLSGGVGLIEVAAKTDVEKGYLFKKMQNAVNSSQAAMEEGVIAGGGLALKQIADKMPKNILTEALKVPYEKIQESAGGKLDFSATEVVDPLKVTRTALENACSFAGMFITTNGLLAWKRGSFEDTMKEMLRTNKDDKSQMYERKGLNEL